MRQALTQNGTHCNADGESREKCGKDINTATKHIAGIHRKLRKVSGAKQPEPGNCQDGLEDHSALCRITHQFPCLDGWIEAQDKLGVVSCGFWNPSADKVTNNGNRQYGDTDRYHAAIWRFGDQLRTRDRAN